MTGPTTNQKAGRYRAARLAANLVAEGFVGAVGSSVGLRGVLDDDGTTFPVVHFDDGSPSPHVVYQKEETRKMRGFGVFFPSSPLAVLYDNGFMFTVQVPRLVETLCMHRCRAFVGSDRM